MLVSGIRIRANLSVGLWKDIRNGSLPWHWNLYICTSHNSLLTLFAFSIVLSLFCSRVWVLLLSSPFRASSLGSLIVGQVVVTHPLYTPRFTHLISFRSSVPAGIYDVVSGCSFILPSFVVCWHVFFSNPRPHPCFHICADIVSEKPITMSAPTEPTIFFLSEIDLATDRTGD